MFLTVDIGNSNIVMGLHDGLSWVNILREPTHLSDYSGIFNQIQQYLPQIKDCILSSVVPSVTRPVEVALRTVGIPYYKISKATYQHLDISINNPDEIGTDLVSNASYAHKKYPNDYKIIVDFGTALTFTTLDNEGKIIGVSIAPGLKTAMYSLFANAEQLPEVPLELPQSALGTDTVTALQSGVLLGYSHLVSGMIKQIQKEIGVELKVMATGGLSFIMENIEGVFDEVNVHLTLEGMRLVYEQAAGK